MHPSQTTNVVRRPSTHTHTHVCVGFTRTLNSPGTFVVDHHCGREMQLADDRKTLGTLLLAQAVSKSTSTDPAPVALCQGVWVGGGRWQYLPNLACTVNIRGTSKQQAVSQAMTSYTC